MPQQQYFKTNYKEYIHNIIENMEKGNLVSKTYSIHEILIISRGYSSTKPVLAGKRLTILILFLKRRQFSS